MSIQEGLVAGMRAWHEAQKDKRKEYNRLWRAKNKDKIKEYNRLWRAKNKDKKLNPKVIADDSISKEI